MVFASEREDVEAGVGKVQLAARRAGLAAAFRASKEITAAIEMNILKLNIE